MSIFLTLDLLTVIFVKPVSEDSFLILISDRATRRLKIVLRRACRDFSPGNPGLLGALAINAHVESWSRRKVRPERTTRGTRDKRPYKKLVTQKGEAQKESCVREG